MQIDANEEISELALEGRGSGFDDFDAFDEIQEFFKSASFRGPVDRGSRNRRKSTRKYLSWRWRVGGSEFDDFDAFDEIEEFF